MLEERKLYEVVREAGFTPEHAAEVGVYLPEQSNVLGYITAGVRCTLVEPDPGCARAIEEQFGDRPNLTLHRVAVFHTPGQVTLAQRSASTYVTELSSSPAIVNDGYDLDEQDTFTVDAVTFDQIDDGTIDLLGVDVEGCEWFVIEKMVSRPAVLAIETHGFAYVNPHLREINAWAADNGYKVWYRTESDTVYVRGGAIRVGLRDRIKLARTDWKLFKVRWRHRLRSALNR